MRITTARKPAAALLALAISSAAAVGFAGTAHATPSAVTESTRQAASHVDVTITWDLHSHLGVGFEGVLPEEDPSLQPADVIVTPSDAEGSVRFVATSAGESIDLGLQPLVDGRSVAPTWELPGGPVVNGGRSAVWYSLTAEFVPDAPSEYQGAVPDRNLGWVQLTNPDELAS
jgi:hypothetical protein